jgi:SAM-dependent methyltransferase
MNKICQSCGKTGLITFLSLGNMPLVNSLLEEKDLDKIENKYPLDVAFCPHCSLVQITEVIPPEILFSDYVYFSSFSDTVLQNAKNIVEQSVSRYNLNSESLVIELASNDGYLLQYYKEHDVPVLGVEPAKNIAQVANDRGISTISEFFNEDLAIKLSNEGKKADIIHANNVLAHVSDINSFVAGIENLLKDNGTAIIETPYVRDLIDHTEFDTIYHEHLYYYSLTSVSNLFRRHNLVIQSVERIPIHGGSLRLFIGKSRFVKPDYTVKNLMAEETILGICEIGFYKNFAKKVEFLKKNLVSILQTLKNNGNHIAAYGAAAKGCILLNYFGIESNMIDFVADRSTYKQNHYMPGVHIPICPPEKLLENHPDYTIILAWNFADEIIQQQCKYTGRFIIPIPEIKII